jgi:hypothetical protein
MTDDRGFFGAGFAITDDKGAPIVAFGYSNAAAAARAQVLMEEAIGEASSIVTGP